MESPLKIAEVELMTPTAQIIAAVGPLGSIDEPAAKRVFILGGENDPVIKPIFF
jgi:hypothetical protein